MTKFQKKFTFLFSLILLFGLSQQSVLAQTSRLFVPLIGITSVPDPLALPTGGGTVTYQYAVKNFLQEVPLQSVQVVDDKCSTITFITGDDDSNSLLDYGETWRYICTTKLSETTQSIATAIGIANNITATHKAYTMVIVGSNTPPPLVSIVNITKVAYPLSLPSEGGKITFTYKVNNPGVVPLSYVTVTDDKCSAMSSRLGDTNGNNLLDIHEVWIYTCTATLKETTTNRAHVMAFANGLQAVSDATLTVNVATSLAQAPQNPRFPNVGNLKAAENPSLKIIVWTIFSGILVILIVVLFLTRERRLKKLITQLTDEVRGKK